MISTSQRQPCRNSGKPCLHLPLSLAYRVRRGRASRMKRGIHANSSIAQTALSGANESDSHFVFTHALLENVLAIVLILNHYTSTRLAEWTLFRSSLLYDGLQHQIEQKESRNPRGNHCLNKQSNLFLLRVQLLIRFHREIPPSQGGVVNLLVPRWLALGRQAIVQQQLLVFDLRNADRGPHRLRFEHHGRNALPMQSWNASVPTWMQRGTSENTRNFGKRLRRQRGTWSRYRMGRNKSCQKSGTYWLLPWEG